jgi:hypothetical protein
MGDVIRSTAAVDDIFADVRTSLANAVAKDGIAKTIAEARLGPTLAMLGTVDAELKEARETATPLLAEEKAENDRADALLDRIYDEVWNDVGRPSNDRVLSLIFPGGADYYTDGDTAEQSDRMELLAQLLERKIHPKLTQDQVTAYAARIREGAKALSADVEAARLPRARVKLLERVRTKLGRTAQFDLAGVKRACKNEGMSEAEIHTIIPDRPPPKKKTPAGGAPAGQPPTPT